MEESYDESRVLRAPPESRLLPCQSRIYVDRATFLASIGAALTSLLQLTCTLCYDKHANGLTLAALLRWKLGNSAVKLHRAAAQGAPKLSDVSGGDANELKRKASALWDRLPVEHRGDPSPTDFQLCTHHPPQSSTPPSGQAPEDGSAPKGRSLFQAL
ncbi:hypothetical protein KFL_003180020 [Klebsormidium nitens]|uniref:Uncharacterized protein n=1 Tax=Klebsormidium nitens TaxID=105231 RepID=A0A1Y1ICQ2_KLENI|nr:hypothetical protein KFL_003180020 [Klebsormidium nitens]|eukprot:GAQ86881.1 hypothetical protein KFL_003180020 [Klebsormidium nitens]